jgi:hypothetical protein
VILSDRLGNGIEPTMKICSAFALSALLLLASSVDAFVPSSSSSSSSAGSIRSIPRTIHQPLASSSASIDETTGMAAAVAIDVRTGKPTGTSFLPKETKERAMAGSPIEKIKMAKDGTSAFVEKADLDTVCNNYRTSTRLDLTNVWWADPKRDSNTSVCFIGASARRENS